MKNVTISLYAINKYNSLLTQWPCLCQRQGNGLQCVYHSAITEELRIEATFIVNLSLSAVTLRAMMVFVSASHVATLLY